MKINKKFTKAARRMLSVAVCLVMLFTTFFIFDPAVLSELFPKASAADVVYSKVTNQNGTWTSGTDYTLSGSTYTIKTGNGFAYFLKNPTTFNGKKVILDCNVDFSGITYAYWDDNPTAWYGELDGANHIVANYTQNIDGKEDKTVGCFGVIRRMTGGVIKDLTVKNAYIRTLNRRDKGGASVYALGALVGKIQNESSGSYTDVQITNVTVDGATIIKMGRDGRKNDYGRECGGIVGWTNKKTVFTNCKVVNSKVSPNQDDNRRGNKEGGFLGKSEGAEVIIQNDTQMVSVDAATTVYADDLSDKDSDHGGLIGWTSGKTTIKNVIMNATVYSGQSGGGFIGYIENAEANISDCTFNGKVVATDFTGGLIGNSGSNTVFNISNCKNTGSVSGKQMVGGIIGKATGNTLTVTNCSNEGTVTSSDDFIGGIVGRIEGINSSKFENCVNNGTITGKTWYIGGIVGQSNNDSNITFNNCKNTVNITSASNRYIGGIVGYAKGKTIMNNCVNTGNISGAQYTAGLCAWIQDDGCEITNCLNTGSVTGNGNSNVGGILATIDSQASNPTWTFKNLVNTGTIYGASATGGILGYMGNTDDPGKVVMTDCINKGNIVVTGNDAGGIVGNMYNHGSTTLRHAYTNCYNYGNVSSSSTGDTFIGGIVGKEYGFADFTNCINYGNITETATSGNNIAGGIVGWIQDDASTVKNCMNYGQISGRNNVGGIVGEFSGSSTLTITQCGNYGTLVAKNAGNTQIGGIMGRFNGSTIYLSKCFNGNGTDGTIAASGSKGLYAGGLIGYGNTIYVADSYNNAPAVYGNTSGGLVGWCNSSVYLYNSYNKTTTGVTTQFSGNKTATTYGCYNSSTISTGTSSLSTLNTGRTVSGISSVGNSYAYKAGINANYPVLSWQVNTLTKNVGRNLIADLIADTAKSGYRAQGLSYDIKLDGVTKTYYPSYTKDVNGVTVTYNTMSDLFTLDGTPTTTGTFDILSATNTEAKNVFFSTYYVGGNAMGCSATVYTSTISRTSSTHMLKSLSTGERVEVFLSVNPNVPVDFDNFKFHASMDYTKNVTATSDSLVDLHSTYSDLGTPTKIGYNFLGWYNQRSGGTKITDGSTKVNSSAPSFSDTLDRDFDIYAHWDPITYTIKYNGNGATSGDTASSSHTYDEEKNLTANGFFREFDVTFDYNYSGSTSTKVTAAADFNGWATSADGAVVYQDRQPVLNLTAKDKKVINLYANWTDKSVSLPSASRTGYTFDGWYTEATGGTKIEGSYTPTETTTLYAHWTPITYTVSYDGNGATGGSTANSSHTYDVAQNLTKNGFERKFTVTFNYNDGRTETRTVDAVSTFNGWICSKNGIHYDNEAEVKNLTDKSETITMTAQWTDASVDIPTTARSGYTFSGWTDQEGKQVSGSITPTEDMTLTANWDAITYTVSYDGNGGSGATADSKHTYDVAQNLTKNGFERKFTVTFNYNDGVTANTVSTVKSDFNGWLCSKDGKTYADEAEVKNLTDESETITMTAQWTDKTVTVPETERENYIFLGWFDGQGNEYTGTFTPTSDLVLTAKWQEKAKYTITFKNGDEILQQSEWYVDTMPTFDGDEPTKESDDHYEYAFSGWSPEITKVTGEATYEAQFTAAEHHFKSVKVDGETHRSECDCGYKLESIKHNIELKDGKYTCKDCGYVVPDFNAVTTDGATLTKTLRADMTTKYLVAMVSYPNAAKPNKDGKYFVYWYDNISREIVSAFTTYSFFLTKEVDIVPVFATQKDYYTERAKATTVLRMVGCKQNEDKSYSILAERSISSSAGSINSHGMIYTTDASLENSLDWEHRDVDGVKLLTAAVKTKTVRTGLDEAKITGAESGVVYARPYIVLVNADGTTETVYGNVVTYNLTSTQSAESDVLSTSSYDLSDISAEEPIAPTEPTEKNPLEKIADLFARLVEIIKTILSFFGLTGVAR